MRVEITVDFLMQLCRKIYCNWCLWLVLRLFQWESLLYALLCTFKTRSRLICQFSALKTFTNCNDSITRTIIKLVHTFIFTKSIAPMSAFVLYCCACTGVNWGDKSSSKKIDKSTKKQWCTTFLSQNWLVSPLRPPCRLGQWRIGPHDRHQVLRLLPQ